MNNKEFLNYEQCEALEGLNYDGDYDFAYHATGELWERGKKDKKERFLPAPLKQQVLRWFRDECDMGVYITRNIHFVDDNTKWKPVIDNMYYPQLTFNTYEEAENAAIDELIKQCKQ